MSPATHLPEPDVRCFMEAVFEALGVPRADAACCADVLVEADLRGLDTHGLSRLTYYRDRIEAGVTRPVTRPEVVRETDTTAVLDGHHGMGHVIATRAMEMAIAKAAKHGLGAVAVRNSTHYGIAGYYAQMAVEAGMVGLATTNARPAVVPTHSTEPKFGTNPLAFGAPTDEETPFLFDAAMGVTQRGKIEVARRMDKPLPDGLVVDRDGAYLNDPGEVLDGLMKGGAAMLPLGGDREETGSHKGYGLSIIMELLCSALQNGSFLSGLSGGDKEGVWKTYNLGHFFLAINIEAFLPLDQFRLTAGRLVRELRSATKAPGQERVWTAGEKEWDLRALRRAEGIPVPPPLMAELRRLQESLNLPGTARLPQTTRSS